MNNFKKLMMLATIAFTIQQSVTAYDKSADNSQPQHQGLGRIFTAVENTVTLHPGNAVNALATGNQSDTTFGWHEDDNDRIKANRAHTEHNRNKDINSNEHLTYRQRRQLEADRKEQRRLDDRKIQREKKYDREERNEERREERGHWFWKSSDNN